MRNNQENKEKKLNAPKITIEHIEKTIVDKRFLQPYGTLTICILKLKNGILVTGESACVSKENFNKTLGEEVAYKNAKDKIWELEGYLLKEKLWEKAKEEEK